MIRLGALIRFKRGVTKAQASEALARMGEVLDLPPRPSRMGRDGLIPDPAAPRDILREYEEEFGSPVWYIP